MSHTGQTFCFDTSALVDMWWSMYPPDVFPGVWAAVEHAFETGAAIAPKEVKRELMDGLDELGEWAKVHKDYFAAEDEDLVARAKQVTKDYPNLIDPKKEKHDADPWVIALAERENAIVVTHEKKTGGKSVGLNMPRVKIPDVCDFKGLNKGTVADFLRSQGVSFGA